MQLCICDRNSPCVRSKLCIYALWWLAEFNILSFILFLNCMCLLCPNKLLTLACCNFDIHETILIIFIQKVSNQKCFIFFYWLASASRNGKPGNCIFYMLDICQVCNGELFFVSSGVKVNGQYRWDISANVRWYQTLCGWQFCHSARQCTTAPVHFACHTTIVVAWDSQHHFSWAIG